MEYLLKRQLFAIARLLKLVTYFKKPTQDFETSRAQKDKTKVDRRGRDFEPNVVQHKGRFGSQLIQIKGSISISSLDSFVERFRSSPHWNLN